MDTIRLAHGQTGRNEATRRFGDQPERPTTPQRDPGGTASRHRIQRAAQLNPHYRAAVESLPGYQRARDIAADAERRIAELAAPAGDLPSPLHTGAITEEWLNAAVAADIATAAADHRRRILINLRDEAYGEFASLVVIHVDGLLAALNDSLTDVMHRGRALCADLNGARTPAEAITRGPDAAQAWAQLPALLAEYDQIRAAQDVAMAENVDYVQGARSSNNPDDRATDLLLANLDELRPNWRLPGADFSGQSLWAAPWPTDPVEHFVWLCTSDAQPWVPTLAQLNELWSNRKPAPIKTAPSPFGPGPRGSMVRVYK